jgi:hypothetical protein
LQRLRWCGDWRTKLCLYSATLPNSYAIYLSESNSYIHANAYSDCHAYSNSHVYADCDGNGNSYSNSHVYAHSDSNAYRKCPT